MWPPNPRWMPARAALDRCTWSRSAEARGPFHLVERPVLETAPGRPRDPGSLAWLTATSVRKTGCRLISILGCRSTPRRRCRDPRVGGHLPRNGRFWRPCSRPPAAPHSDPCRLQVGARCLPADTRGFLDPPEGPPEAPKSKDLLLLVVGQEVAHGSVGTRVPRRRQRLGPPT